MPSYEDRVFTVTWESETDNGWESNTLLVKGKTKVEAAFKAGAQLNSVPRNRRNLKIKMSSVWSDSLLASLP